MRHPLPQDWREGVIQVDLVGVGGTGSQVLTGLARLHLALLALGAPGLLVSAYDPDTVSEANIGRQLFSPSDVGLYKADVLIHRLNCFFGLNWKSRPIRYEAPNNPSRLLLVVSCVDSAAARRGISSSLNRRTSSRWDTYWLDCGNSRRSGQVFLTQFVSRERLSAPALPSLRHWLSELFDESLPEDDAPSCSLAESLEQQDLFINQMVATWALHLLWSFIRDGGLDVCGYWISLESGMVAPVPIPVLDASQEAGARPCGGMQG